MNFHAAAGPAAFVLCLLLASNGVFASIHETQDMIYNYKDHSYGVYKSNFHVKYSASNSFPADPTDLDGWINYGIGVGVGFGIIFVLGIIFTVAMWIAAFCIKHFKKCIPAFPDCIKQKYHIGFAMYAFIMLFLGFLAIGLTVGATNAINGSVESVGTFADHIGAFGGDIASDLRTVTARLSAQVDAVNQTLASFRFSTIYNVIDTLDLVLTNTNAEIGYLNSTIYAVDAEYKAILSNYTYLQQKERDGKISNVPRNSSIIETPRDNDQLLINSKANLNTYESNVVDARDTVEFAEGIYRVGRDLAISAAKAAINGRINEQIDGISELTTGLSFSRQNINNTVGPYIKIQNDARMGVVFSFVLLNFVFLAVWFVAFLKNKPILTESPFWVASFTVFWIMTFAAVHIALFIPVRDICDRKISYIQSSGVNNRLRTLIPDSLTSITAFSDLLDTITNDPLLILDCGQNETFFSRTNLTLFDFIPTANGTLADLVDGFINETSKIDVSTQADTALSAFGRTQANLTQVGGKVNNYTMRVQDAQASLAGIEPQLVALLIAAESALIQLENDLNALTVPNNGKLWTRYNYTVPLTDYPGNTTIDDAVRALDAGNTTYTDQVVEVNEIRLVVENMNNTFNRVSIGVADIGAGVDRLQANATLARDSLRTMDSLQSDFITSAVGGIFRAVGNSLEILKLGDVGKCKFVGDFYRNGIEGDVCTNIRNTTGGAGVVLVFFGIFMFLSTWPVLWTRAAIFHGPMGTKEDDL